MFSRKLITANEAKRNCMRVTIWDQNLVRWLSTFASSAHRPINTHNGPHTIYRAAESNAAAHSQRHALNNC